MSLILNFLEHLFVLHCKKRCADAALTFSAGVASSKDASVGCLKPMTNDGNYRSSAAPGIVSVPPADIDFASLLREFRRVQRAHRDFRLGDRARARLLDKPYS